MPAPISVDDALARILEGAEPGPPESVPLRAAAGRVLAGPVRAMRTQPPFAAAAMDGYALRAADVARLPARLRLVGMAAAGHRFSGRVEAGEAVRIFTGAPLPAGADTILIQENAAARPDGTIEAAESVPSGRHIRPMGLDFAAGEVLLHAGRVVDAAVLSLAAAANHATLSVVRRPLIALIATGDELVPPGSQPGRDQIIASNGYGVAALVEAAGAAVLDLGIVGDRRRAIAGAVRRALRAGADVIVTLGGASVGDHDLVGRSLADEGMTPVFSTVAMRPGKPLMFGRLGGARVIGLPGNPVASLIGAQLFLVPLAARLAGRDFSLVWTDAVLAVAMPANGGRHDYLRALVSPAAGRAIARPFERQDSSMLRTLAEANALLVREPFAAAAAAGDPCRVLMLR